MTLTEKQKRLFDVFGYLSLPGLVAKARQKMTEPSRF
jgi:hypothetical protein